MRAISLWFPLADVPARLTCSYFLPHRRPLPRRSCQGTGHHMLSFAGTGAFATMPEVRQLPTRGEGPHARGLRTALARLWLPSHHRHANVTYF